MTDSALTTDSTNATNTGFASQNPIQPETQFALAQQLTQDRDQESTNDARYWLEQSALQGYLPAQKQLAEDYARGLNGSINDTQAIYWFTSVALSDPTDRGYLLANFIQHHQAGISNSELVEAWYQLAALKNPQAEHAYSQFLEDRFNRLREKQVSEIIELDKRASDTERQNTVAPQQELNAEDAKIWYVAGVLAVVLILIGGALGYRIRTQKSKSFAESETAKSQQLETQVKELTFVNKQLKRQLEKVFKEFKKIRSQSDNQKLLIACAMFGYTPLSIPDSKAVRLRYKQLSKLYHPDTRGTEEEMKRLNQAFKLLSQNMTKA
nr:J domain-containing protein [Vibrio sp. AND4]